MPDFPEQGGSAFLSRGDEIMSERNDAIRLAHKILSDSARDPDDDLSVLSRQFLRSREIIERQEEALQAVDWESKATTDLIAANRDQLLKMHEEAVVRVRRCRREENTQS